MRILRDCAQSKNERVRLQAALRMADILLNFDQSQERIAIAAERAAARRAEAENVSNTPAPKPEPRVQPAVDAARAFLDRIQTREVHDEK
jgi:hypothetical protein